MKIKGSTLHTTLVGRGVINRRVPERDVHAVCVVIHGKGTGMGRCMRKK